MPRWKKFILRRGTAFRLGLFMSLVSLVFFAGTGLAVLGLHAKLFRFFRRF